jgi:pimeloyl-ACP methyl ester carboxylesterase
VAGAPPTTTPPAGRGGGRFVSRLALWQDRITTDVDVLGDGPPLVYFHGPWGLPPDLPFVRELSRTYTVYAPRFPGTTPGNPEAIHQLDSLLDLVVYHTELLDQLDLDAATVMGHSVGGMLACELAAAVRDRVAHLVLIDSVGLWRDDQPVRNWMITPDEALRKALFANPAGAVADAFFAEPAEPEPRADRIWALACTAKFIWPIPDNGLRRRIHRVRAQTLLVWGRHDGIVPAAYACEFAARTANSHAMLIEDAGHLPHLERTAEVIGAISEHASST